MVYAGSIIEKHFISYFLGGFLSRGGSGTVILPPDQEVMRSNIGSVTVLSRVFKTF